MATDALADETGDIGTDALPRKKFSGKRLVLYVVLPFLLLVGGGAAVFFSGILDPAPKSEETQADAKPEPLPGPGIFFTIPDILVNLNSTNRRPSFLKISISIEVSRHEDIATLEKVMPRIIDNFQVYLRELRLEDLRGSAGVYRMREELLMRVNTAAHPVRVKDVLFREMLIQ